MMHMLKPWMRKFIVESKERVEKSVDPYMDQKVKAIHRRLDNFEVRVSK